MSRELILDFSPEQSVALDSLCPTQTLSLNGCSEWVTDEVIERFSIGGNLESVSLFRCWRITDRGVFHLMRTNGSRVKRLCLAGCTNISDKSLAYIARFSIAGIESLDVTRCPRISDLGINHLSQSRFISHSLKSLRLYSDSQLGTSTYDAIGEFLNLEELDLCGHTNLSDERLLSILTNCSNLRSLNLSWCTSLTDMVIRGIIQNGLLGKVQSLSLFGNKAMSNASDLVEYLGHTKAPIRELDIRGIPAASHLTANNCQGLRKLLTTIENWKLHT